MWKKTPVYVRAFPWKITDYHTLRGFVTAGLCCGSAIGLKLTYIHGNVAGKIALYWSKLFIAHSCSWGKCKLHFVCCSKVNQRWKYIPFTLNCNLHLPCSLHQLWKSIFLLAVNIILSSLAWYLVGTLHIQVCTVHVCFINVLYTCVMGVPH